MQYTLMNAVFVCMLAQSPLACAIRASQSAWTHFANPRAALREGFRTSPSHRCDSRRNCAANCAPPGPWAAVSAASSESLSPAAFISAVQPCANARLLAVRHLAAEVRRRRATPRGIPARAPFPCLIALLLALTPKRHPCPQAFAPLVAPDDLPACVSALADLLPTSPDKVGREAKLNALHGHTLMVRPLP